MAACRVGVISSLWRVCCEGEGGGGGLFRVSLSVIALFHHARVPAHSPPAPRSAGAHRGDDQPDDQARHEASQAFHSAIPFNTGNAGRAEKPRGIMRQHLALLLLCAAWRDAAAQLFRRPHDVVNGCTGGNLTACIAACPSNPPKAYQDCVNACVKACTKPKVPSVYTVPFNVSSSTGVAFEGFEFHGNATTVGGTQLKLKGNNRGYAVKDYKATKWPDVKYTKLQLLGKTLSWSTDVSNVGCGCNAALYLVAMPDGGNASGARYCDIQMKPPNGCVELDLQEGNAKAMQATLHTVYEDPPSADGVCNQWGVRLSSLCPCLHLFSSLTFRPPFFSSLFYAHRSALSIGARTTTSSLARDRKAASTRTSRSKCRPSLRWTAHTILPSRKVARASATLTASLLAMASRVSRSGMWRGRRRRWRRA